MNSREGGRAERQWFQIVGYVKRLCSHQSLIAQHDDIRMSLSFNGFEHKGFLVSRKFFSGSLCRQNEPLVPSTPSSAGGRVRAAGDHPVWGEGLALPSGKGPGGARYLCGPRLNPAWVRMLRGVKRFLQAPGGPGRALPALCGSAPGIGAGERSVSSGGSQACVSVPCPFPFSSESPVFPSGLTDRGR